MATAKKETVKKTNKTTKVTPKKETVKKAAPNKEVEIKVFKNGKELTADQIKAETLRACNIHAVKMLKEAGIDRKEIARITKIPATTLRRYLSM